MNGTPLTVVGVTPADYKGLYVDGGFDFWVPLTVLNRQLSTDPNRPVRGLNAVARLRPGVTLEQARAAIEASWPALRVSTIPPGLGPTDQNEMRTQRVKVESLSTGFSSLRTRYGDPLVVLVGITALLLAIGCVNLSGLLLARTAAQDELTALRSE